MAKLSRDYRICSSKAAVLVDSRAAFILKLDARK